MKEDPKSELLVPTQSTGLSQATGLNSICFYLQSNKTTPMIELRENGDIMVRGKLIENDKELVDGLREWFHLAKIERA